MIKIYALLFVFLLEAKLIFSSIPTKFEAASLAKQLVAKNGVGDLVVDVKHNGETFPFARTDLYTMDCNNENSDHLSGSILLFSTSLGVTINSLLTNSQQAAFSLHENFDEYKQENSYQVVTKHRLTLVGNVEINLPKYGEPGYQETSECFFQKHPAARHWEGLVVCGNDCSKTSLAYFSDGPPKKAVKIPEKPFAT